jgi:hypothetical protein
MKSPISVSAGCGAANTAGGYDRVVLFAEAASGKTEEFKNAAAGLRAKGSPAFVTIENLADRNFLPDPADQALLQRCRLIDPPAGAWLEAVSA